MQIVKRWGPAFLMMAVIFLVSSQPSSNLPNFDLFDKAVKKGGHMIGYALLAASYSYGLKAGRTDADSRSPFWLAWLFAFIFALTDEYHQSFVPGRYPSIWDVVIFDNLGALIALLLYSRLTGSYGTAKSPE